MAYFDRATFGLDFIACLKEHERLEAAMEALESEGRGDEWLATNGERLANAGKMADLVVQVVAHAMGGRG